MYIPNSCENYADPSSHQLPDDVFVDGETKPSKPIKEKKKKATSTRSKVPKSGTKANSTATISTTNISTKAKRQFEETGLEVRNPRLVKASRH
jgi:poly(A) polymerase